MASASPTQASLLLQKQLKDLCKNPVDGFSAGLVDESNIFEWSVTIIGPPDTLYDGGFFNAIMSFPPNYPNSPPTVKFTSEVWHPNVYPDGRVCISILHPPGEDPNGYELASERWTPVHTVESIVLSIISMLSSPNDESPANIEAARYWKCTRGCKLCFQECWLQKQEAAYPCNVIDDAYLFLFSIAFLYFCVLELLFLNFLLIFQVISEGCFYFSCVIDSLRIVTLGWNLCHPIFHNAQQFASSMHLSFPYVVLVLLIHLLSNPWSVPIISLTDKVRSFRSMEYGLWFFIFIFYFVVSVLIHFSFLWLDYDMLNL